MQQDLLHRKHFLKFYEVRSERWNFNSCEKWSSTFNALVVVGVVFLLLFRLPTAILWQRIYMINHPSTGYGKKKKKIRTKENGEHVAAMIKIGEWQCVVELLALLAWHPSFLAEK